MGFYSQVVFPRLCNFFLDTPLVAKERRTLLAQAKGDVLEIGLGTGLNLPHYPAEIRRLASVDPNPGMHRLAQRRIQETGIEVSHHRLKGEALPFEDASFDVVVSTFTLCSIDNVPQALSEAFRVLKPGGRLLFLEHGLSPEPAVQKWQRRLNWLQGILGNGCRLDRDIPKLIAGQPFTNVETSEHYLEHAPKTHGYLYRGSATK